MKIAHCKKCGKEQEIRTLVHNRSDIQYTYDEGRQCGHQVTTGQKRLPKGFMDNERQKKWRIK